MNSKQSIFVLFFSILSLNCLHSDGVDQSNGAHDPIALVELFSKWRSIEKPPLLEGAPYYRKETFDDRHHQFQKLQDELGSIDTVGWSILDKVDWTFIWSEMNGYDFNYRVLKP